MRCVHGGSSVPWTLVSPGMPGRCRCCSHSPPSDAKEPVPLGPTSGWSHWCPQSATESWGVLGSASPAKDRRAFRPGEWLCAGTGATHDGPAPYERDREAPGRAAPCPLLCRFVRRRRKAPGETEASPRNDARDAAVLTNADDSPCVRSMRIQAGRSVSAVSTRERLHRYGSSRIAPLSA